MTPDKRRYRQKYWTELTARAHKLGEERALDLEDRYGKNLEFWRAAKAVAKAQKDELDKLYEERWS